MEILKRAKMTAAQLLRRIRIGMRRHDLSLAHMGYYSNEFDPTGGLCCAIGGALAYAAKTDRELKDLVRKIQDEPTTGDHHWAEAGAKILNHGLSLAT